MSKPVGSEDRPAYRPRRKNKVDALEEVTVSKIDRTPPTALVAPPRELVAGEPLAVYHGQCITQYGDVDLYHPFRFNRWEAGRLHVDNVHPWQSPHCFWYASFGEPTGFHRDRAITFVRFAEGVTFYRLCPTCRGYGMETIEETLAHPLFPDRIVSRTKTESICSHCAGLTKIVYDPWTETTFARPRRWNAGIGAAPTFIEQGKDGAPPGHVIVGVTMAKHGANNSVTFTTMHVDDVARLEAEAAANSPA